MLHYLIHNYNGGKKVTKSVLFSLLYFTDFNFFELYEKSLTDEIYKKSSGGPKPLHFDLVIEELINENKIGVKTEMNLDTIKSFYYSLVKPLDNFQDNELNVIGEVIDDLGQMNLDEIADYTSRDIPIKAACENEFLDYGFVFYRDFPFEKRIYDNFN